MFATVGNNDFKLWKVDDDGSEDLVFLQIPLAEEVCLTSITCSPVLPTPYNSPLLIMGTHNGDIILFNPMTNQFEAKIAEVCKSQIGLIKATETSILIGDAEGNLSKQQINPGQTLFSTEGIELVLGSPVSAISFDPDNNEGLVGLMNGEARYLNWSLAQNVKLLNSHIGGPVKGHSFIKGP